MVKKYGQTVLVTQDLALENYLEKCVRISPLTTRQILTDSSASNRLPRSGY